MNSKSSPQPLKDILNPLMKRWADEKRPGAEDIRRMWRKLVGTKAAQHSCPTSLRKGELLVAVDTSVWLWNLSLRRGEFLKELQASWGSDSVQSVRFKIKPLSKKDSN
ncbi:MAG: DUF721 domain-containing protein [Candidatus Omnitrophica bacterium]|nr:DUF721 domain-containing protein [Candidatus Omnitrophota bacterium]